MKNRSSEYYVRPNSRALVLPPVLVRPPANTYRRVSEGVATVGEFDVRRYNCSR